MATPSASRHPDGLDDLWSAVRHYTNTMAEAAPALSEYEQLRVANILRNAAELKRLGLDVAAHTMAALGKQAGF